MDLLKQIVKWLEDRKIFSRKRKSNEMRALKAVLKFKSILQLDNKYVLC